jgi:hypothetical protein
MSPAPVPAQSAVARWAPWIVGAAVAIAYAAIGPRGAAVAVGGGHGVWDALVALAAMLPVGELADRAQLLAAVCAGAAVVLAVRLVIGLGGGDAAAIAGAIAAAAVMAGAAPWAQGATAVGPIALASVLVLAAVTLADRVAAGGGAWPGTSAGVAIGLAIAVDAAALALVPVVLALYVIRLRHGARWPLVAAAAGAAAWAIAMIPAWRAGAAAVAPAAGAAMSHEAYAIAFADAVGAIAAVAAACGVLAALARRSTRWTGAIVTAALVGGIALDRAAGHGIGALPVVAVALAAGLGVARLARLVGPPVGQACVGAAAAVIVALPAALASAL